MDNMLFVSNRWKVMKAELTRPRAIFDQHAAPHWRLDQTECALRQRLKLRPDASERILVRTKGQNTDPAIITSPEVIDSIQHNSQELDYEVVSTTDTKLDPEDEEDRNRKVLRSLDLGDEVKEVCGLSTDLRD